MKLPVGLESFSRIIEQKLDFVDKTLLVKELIDTTETDAIVITRPRRFGKTFNLSMLHHFLAPEVNGKSTQGLFNYLKIAAAGEQYMQHQGQYPVIFMTFKNISYAEFTLAHAALYDLITKTYQQHRYLISSPKLYEEEKKAFALILEGNIRNDVIFSQSLLNLTDYLRKHHGIKPWLLIDEYDTPIQRAYLDGPDHFDKIIDLMRELFGSVLKTNDNYYKAVITGILRIAKENLFSTVSNLEAYSLLDQKFARHFGFTENEVDQLLKKSNLEDKSLAIRDWYNGYQAGDVTLYNPLSIAKCINEQGLLKPYWVNTSDNILIKKLLMQSNLQIKSELDLLLQGKTIEHMIHDRMIFSSLSKNPSTVWSLLFMSGYLKVVKQERNHRGLTCTLDIPNREVRDLYLQMIEEWLSPPGYDVKWLPHFLNLLLSGDVKQFAQELKQVMETIASYHDFAQNPEAYYHGLMMGLIVNLFYDKNYEIMSNKESGYGRPDYLILSHDKSKPTLILELKAIPTSKKFSKDSKLLNNKLDEAAAAGILQINQLEYLSEAKKRGCTYIIKIALAFCGKRFKINYEQEAIT